MHPGTARTVYLQRAHGGYNKIRPGSSLGSNSDFGTVFSQASSTLDKVVPLVGNGSHVLNGNGTLLVILDGQADHGLLCDDDPRKSAGYMVGKWIVYLGAMGQSIQD